MSLCTHHNKRSDQPSDLTPPQSNYFGSYNMWFTGLLQDALSSALYNETRMSLNLLTYVVFDRRWPVKKLRSVQWKYQDDPECHREWVYIYIYIYKYKHICIYAYENRHIYINLVFRAGRVMNKKQGRHAVKRTVLTGVFMERNY